MVNENFREAERQTKHLVFLFYMDDLIIPRRSITMKYNYVFTLLVRMFSEYNIHAKTYFGTARWKVEVVFILPYRQITWTDTATVFSYHIKRDDVKSSRQIESL